MKELDLGESESIERAIETKASYLIIDEYLGRQIAEEYDVRIVGVLEILIRAKQEGLISEVKMHTLKLKDIDGSYNPSSYQSLFGYIDK